MGVSEAFEPDGVVAVVGAGGKKSTLYALAADLGTAILTATVRVPQFDGHVDRLAVTADPVAAAAGNDAWPLGLVPGRDGDRRLYLGYETTRIDELAKAVDVPVLVKADGARRRLLKAPGEDEPQIPASAGLVVVVASVRAVGEPLSEEHVHRPARVAAVTDLAVGDRIEPEHVVALLTHGKGGLKRVPDDARVVVLLNMVDDRSLETTAREMAADIVEDARVDRVVLGRMDLRNVVDVIE